MLMSDRPAVCFRRVAVVRVLVACLMLLSLAADATSDKSVKRRQIRHASQEEKWLEDMNNAAEERALAGLSAEDRAGYNRDMLEFVDNIPEQLGTSEYTNIRAAINMTYLQCVHHAQRWMKLHPAPDNSGRLAGTLFGVQQNPITTDPFKAYVASGDHKSVCGTSGDCSVTSNPCALQSFIPYEELFSGIDKVIFVGDSTTLRDYKYILGQFGLGYKQKVSDLPTPHIHTTIKMSSGRTLELHFFRLLYSSLSDPTIRSVFEVATPNTVILATLGPHDTSWLIFDRLTFTTLGVMPGMTLAKDYDKRTGKRIKQSDVMSVNIARAKKYWVSHIARTVQTLGEELRSFELRELAKRKGDAYPPGGTRLRPFVVFREQFYPKCSDPKYASRPHTRCVGMLKRLLVPFMRNYLRAHLSLINVPVVGMDAMTARAGLPCFLLDAGHLPRPCKSIELQLFAQAFRLGRRLRVLQGFPLSSSPVYGPGVGNVKHLLDADGADWWQLARRVTLLRPRGVTHPHILVRGNPVYMFDPILVPPRSAYTVDEWRLLERFSIPALVERDLTAGGDSGAADVSKDADGSSDQGQPASAASGAETTAPTASAKTNASLDDTAVLVLEDAVAVTDAEKNIAALATAKMQRSDTEPDDVLGPSTYRATTSSKLSMLTIVSFLALTAVVLLLWARVE